MGEKTESFGALLCGQSHPDWEEGVGGNSISGEGQTEVIPGGQGSGETAQEIPEAGGPQGPEDQLGQGQESDPSASGLLGRACSLPGHLAGKLRHLGTRRAPLPQRPNQSQ